MSTNDPRSNLLEPPTKPKDALVGNGGAAAYHVPRMTLSELVIANIAPFHACLCQSIQNGGNFGASGYSLELEGNKDVGNVRRVVPINKFCDHARVDDSV